MIKRLTLKEAREKGKLKQFIKERSDQPPADAERFERLINTAAKPKTAKTSRKSSRKGSSDD